MIRSLAAAPRKRGRLVVGLCIVLLGAVAVARVTWATMPHVPLPAPAFTFDLSSPTVQAGIVNASDILFPNPDGPHPAILLPGPALGLMSPLDDLDALSLDASLLGSADPYGLLLSVTRETIGGVPAAPEYVELGVPYNVFDQAMRGHAAGDQFMSTALFGRGGLRGGPSNSVMNRNNYDEGGTDFNGQPPTHAHNTVSGVPEDSVNGTGTPPQGRLSGPIENVFFSLTAESPSLDSLPGMDPSGANIYFNPQPLALATTQLFATWYELGLKQSDDIDALVVYDKNFDGWFGPEDWVLFSLSPGSPSLTSIPEASDINPQADVFIGRLDLLPELFAPAARFGLIEQPDDIDALDLYPCDDSLFCAQEHGILAITGDLNCDGYVNNFDISAFVLALTSTPPDYPEYYARYPDCWHMFADVNGDEAVNNFDICPFVNLLTSP